MIASSLALLAASLAAGAVTAASDATERARLVVGTSGDYPPFSEAASEGTEAAGTREAGAFVVGDPRGFDPDLVRAYASERGLDVVFVRFRWPELMADLDAARFDMAVGGVTVRPERSLAGRFTVPVASAGAVALVPETSAARRVDELDRTGVRLAVNQGGHLERVARRQFPQARILAIADNGAVLNELLAGRADAVVTDSVEAPRWRARAPGLRALGPFTRDRKAWLVRADLAERAVDLDAWLLARERDGTLAKHRIEQLGADAGGEPTATPLRALLAAIDERLALMPAVAEAKRASGGAIEQPEREARVIEDALAAVRRADAARAEGVDVARADADRADAASADARGGGEHAARAATPALDAAVRALFRAQIEAAKAVQRTVLAAPPGDAAAPGAADAGELEARIRPALGRIGEKIAALVVALPATGSLDAETARRETRDALAAHGLAEAYLDAIADAIVAVARAGTAER